MNDDHSMPSFSLAEARHLKGNLATLLYSTKIPIDTRISLLKEKLRLVYPEGSKTLSQFDDLAAILKQGDDPFRRPWYFLRRNLPVQDLRKIIKEAQQLIDLYVREIPDSELDSRVESAIYRQLLRSRFVWVAGSLLLVVAGLGSIGIVHYDNKFSQKLIDVELKSTALDTEIVKIRRELDKISNEATKEVQKTINAIIQQRGQFIGKVEKAANEIDKKKQTALDEIVAQANAQLAKLSDRVIGFQERAEKLEELLSGSEGSIASVTQRVTTLDESVTGRGKDLSKLGLGIIELSSKVETSQTTYEELVEKVGTTLGNQINRTVERLADTNKAVTKLVEKIEANRSASKASSEKIAEFESSAMEAAGRIGEAEKSTQKQRERLGALIQRLDQSVDAIQKTTEQEGDTSSLAQDTLVGLLDRSRRGISNLENALQVSEVRLKGVNQTIDDFSTSANQQIGNSRARLDEINTQIVTLRTDLSEAKESWNKSSPSKLTDRP